jgi:2-keto-4-pentenoate hydratase/2-oxohepta-3-ene-1,7-dioic acid hydratase in catechol pathway
VRLAKIEVSKHTIWAAITDAGAVDLTPAVRSDPHAIKDHLSPDKLRRLADFAVGRPADHSLNELTYSPFLPEPQKIICVGVNYTNRNEEYRDGSELPRYPSLFLRTPTSFTGHDSPLVRPRESEQLDYEGELVLVIGTGGRRISRERALSHVAGVTLMNEGTIRDWVRHAKFNVTQGKNFDESGSVGPWMVTSDELGTFDDMSIQTRVNGEIRQDDNTGSMIFGFEFLIEYISSFTTLQAGDMISTGTPTGAGARFNPPKFLKPGDVVEVSSPQIGTLRNGIVDG